MCADPRTLARSYDRRSPREASNCCGAGLSSKSRHCKHPHLVSPSIASPSSYITRDGYALHTESISPIACDIETRPSADVRPVWFRTDRRKAPIRDVLVLQGGLVLRALSSAGAPCNIMHAHHPVLLTRAKAAKESIGAYTSPSAGASRAAPPLPRQKGSSSRPSRSHRSLSKAARHSASSTLG